jgi:hypothetical protein
VAQGEDPAGDKQVARIAESVADLCDLYIADAEAGRLLTRVKRPKKPSTLRSDKSRIEGHIKPLLGRLPVAAVTGQDIARLMHATAEGMTARKARRGRGLSNLRGGAGTASRAKNSTPHPDSDALPDVPPDWVALSDLPGHIASWHGVSVTVIAAAVVDSVWTGELRPWHRIAGIKPDGRWRQLPDGLTDTGVRPIHDPRPDVPFDYRIVAHDWAAADADRRKGTVGGAGRRRE